MAEPDLRSAVGPRDEAIRKTVHVLLSLIAAAVVWRGPPLEAAVVLAGATTVALAVELGRTVSGRFRSAFHRTLGPLLRGRERRRLTGATTLSLAYTATAVLFPGVPALLGILIAGVADAAAAVVGKRAGRIRYPGGKSLEGSLTFLAVAFLLLVPMPGGVGRAGLVAILLTVVEALTFRVDDNLYLPIAAAAVVSFVYDLPAMTFFS